MNRPSVIPRKVLHTAAGLLLAVLGSSCEEGTGPGPMPDRSPKSVTLSPTRTTVAVFDTILLAATVRDVMGKVINSPSVTWTSSDGAIATAGPSPTGSAPGVRFAMVLGVSPGSVTITATSGTASAIATITVGPPVPVASVTVTPGSATLTQIAQTIQLAATLRDASGNVLLHRPTTWTSDNEAVATVDPTGRVSAVGDGSATVTATCEGVSGTGAIEVVQVSPPPPPPPRLSGVLAFTSYDGDIHLINADGTNLRNLTTDGRTYISTQPAWSSRGDRIAFMRTIWNSNTPWGIYVINADGTNLVRVSPSGAEDDWPALSPDSKRIAFVHVDSSGDAEIYAMNADGTNRARLTTLHQPAVFPAWSPDGQRIAFLSSHDMYTMNADGTNLSAVTNDAAFARPAWSPDGSRIVFAKDSGGNRDFFLINPNGTNLERLTTGANPSEPAWSPDGLHFATVKRDPRCYYDDYIPCNPEIWIVRVADGARSRLNLQQQKYGWSPSWGP